jgi:hypothetical protein
MERRTTVTEARSEEGASSWYDDAPITDEQIESVRRDLGLPVAERGAAFAPFVVRKLLAEIDRLRAAWEKREAYVELLERSNATAAQYIGDMARQLTDEYGLRIRHISTLTEERAIADTLDGALEVLAAFDAKGRADVVSRELLVGGVEEWRKAAEA